jgi:hypothetical protein
MERIRGIGGFASPATPGLSVKLGIAGAVRAYGAVPDLADYTSSASTLTL